MFVCVCLCVCMCLCKRVFVCVCVCVYLFVCVCFSAEDPGSGANKRVQSHEEVLGGRAAATTSFTVNRMGKQLEEKLTGETDLFIYIYFTSFPFFSRSVSIFKSPDKIKIEETEETFS